VSVCKFGLQSTLQGWDKNKAGCLLLLNACFSVGLYGQVESTLVPLRSPLENLSSSAMETGFGL